MATTCNCCGYKSNEVKSGSGVSPTGTRIELKLTHISDLSRDLVQVISLSLYVHHSYFVCIGRRYYGIYM